MPITPDTADDEDFEVESSVESLEDFIAERPFGALAVAFVIGFVAARVLF